MVLKEERMSKQNTELDVLPVTKAGFVIYGDAKPVHKIHHRLQGKKEPVTRYIVAPWSEGRFSNDNELAYQLPKGSVDEGEIEKFLKQIEEEYAPLWLPEYMEHYKEVSPTSGQEIWELWNRNDRLREFTDAIKESTLDKEQIEIALAAIRESYEETGIDVVRLLGPENMRQLLAGETLTNVQAELPSGERVTIKQASFSPIIKSANLTPFADGHTLNRDGKPLRTQVFALQLADGDILKLAHATMRDAQGVEKPLLKNRDAADWKTLLKTDDSLANKRKHHIKREAIEQVRAILPTEPDVLEWLSTGAMPKRTWNHHTTIETPENKEGVFFNALVRDFMSEILPLMHEKHVRSISDDKPIIRNFEELQFLYQYLAEYRGVYRGKASRIEALVQQEDPVASDKVLDALGRPIAQKLLGERDRCTPFSKEELEQLATTLSERAETCKTGYKTLHKIAQHMRETCIEIGVLEGDKGVIKMDTKDTPGRLYQEGASVVPLRDYVQRAVALGEKSESYRDVMLGGRTINNYGHQTISYHDASNGEMRHHADILHQQYSASQLGLVLSIARAADVMVDGKVGIRSAGDHRTALEQTRREALKARAELQGVAPETLEEYPKPRGSYLDKSFSAEPAMAF